MSDKGHAKVGRPDSEVEHGYLYYSYCPGGKGAGCLTPLGITGVVLGYRVSRFAVRNKFVQFYNKDFFGIRIFTDAGNDGLCPNSLGDEVGFYVALSADGLLTDDEVVARNKHIIGALPNTIDFLESEIPQPKETNWQNFLYIHCYWGDSGYMNEGSNTIDESAFRITKHDYDQQL